MHTDFPPARAAWVIRPLLNADELAAWARVEGFDDLVPSAWHLTVVKADPATALNLAPFTVEPSKNRAVLRMGGLIALGFTSAKLSDCHMAHRCAGGWWGYPVYRLHVSFTPAEGQDLQGVRPFYGALRFGPEGIDRWGRDF